MGLKPKDKEEFIDFYVKICKHLIWRMPKVKDKNLAARWLKKIRFDTDTSCNIRHSYMTALMFMIIKQHLFGPFLHPPLDKFLPPLNEQYSLKNISLEYIISKNSKVKKTELGGMYEEKEDPYLYYTLSSDTREYAAVQEIPNFGTHIYLATSFDPMETWPYVPSYLTEIEKMEYYHPCLEIMAHMNDVSCFIDPNIINKQTKQFDEHDPTNPFFDCHTSGIMKNGSLELTRAPTWGSNLLALNPENLYGKDKSQKYENQKKFLFDVFSKIESEIEIDPVLVENFFKKHLSQMKKDKTDKKNKKNINLKTAPYKSESVSTTRTKFSLNDHIRKSYRSRSGSSNNNYNLYETRRDDNLLYDKLKHYPKTNIQKKIDNVNCNGDYKQYEGIKLKDSMTFLFKSSTNKNWESNANIYYDKLFKPKKKFKTFSKEKLEIVPESKNSIGLSETIDQDNLRNSYNRIIRSCLSKNPKTKVNHQKRIQSDLVWRKIPENKE